MDIESEMEEGTVALGDVNISMSLCSSLVLVSGNVLCVSWRFLRCKIWGCPVEEVEK